MRSFPVVSIIRYEVSLALFSGGAEKSWPGGRNKNLAQKSDVAGGRDDKGCRREGGR